MEFDPAMLLAKEFLSRPQQEIASHYGFERGPTGGLVAHSLQDALSVPDGLLQMKGLDSTAKLVYSLMARVALSPPDVCYASQEYLATKLGLGRSVVGHAIKRLKTARLIEEIQWKKALSIAREIRRKWYTNRKMYMFLFHPLLKRKCALGGNEEPEKPE
ncbi:MAG: helix-turn-helix domain-containing protein [Planctomycetes bacterium]|nr:helix-turn-helix domain-containing protein [Planctomycetota bacterium]MCW8137027.1 helix-turn-helix domain-containing protein [Planctomycetota bacterium]